MLAAIRIDKPQHEVGMEVACFKKARALALTQVAQHKKLSVRKKTGIAFRFLSGIKLLNIAHKLAFASIEGHRADLQFEVSTCAFFSRIPLSIGIDYQERLKKVTRKPDCLQVPEIPFGSRTIFNSLLQLS